MSQIITIGKRLIPKEHIAFIEPFDAAAQSKFSPTRDYKARIILLNRDSVLTEVPVEALAETHGFKLLEKDRVAANPGIRFRIETFAPAEDFRPSKPYATRILWRDLDGNEQSNCCSLVPRRFSLHWS